MVITDGQYHIVSQNVQNRFVRIELLNYNFQTVDNLEGIVISGSINIDANSDIRRTASLSLVVKDSSFDISVGGKIWLDKYVRIFVETDNIRSGVRESTNCGLYIIDEPSYDYNATTNTLTLTLLDLMAKLTGIRNGYLKGTPIVLSAGEDIRQAIIDTLALGGFTKYVVETPPEPSVIPNDIEFGQGVVVYDLLSALKDIYPNYEMFFDLEGTFYYKTIPNGINDSIMVDDNVWNNIVLSEGKKVDFQNIKNSIEVYGRTHDPEYYSTNTTVSGRTISLTIEGVESYQEGIIYGFTINNPSEIANARLKINDLSTIAIHNDNGTNTTIPEENGEVFFCVQYDGTYFRWLGHLQAYGFAEDNNPQSPYYVNSTVGRIRLPLYGAEYENCFTDELAQQRAEYELWLHTNMNNAVSLSCVPVPWLDVNILTEYTTKSDKQTNKYIIKSINMGLGATDTMEVEMIRFYAQ